MFVLNIFCYDGSNAMAINDVIIFILNKASVEKSQREKVTIWECFGSEDEAIQQQQQQQKQKNCVNCKN